MAKVFSLVLLVSIAAIMSLLPSSGDAGGCGYRRQAYYSTPYVEQVVETPVLVQTVPTAVVTVPIVVPAFSFQYIPAVTPAAPCCNTAPAQIAPQVYPQKATSPCAGLQAEVQELRAAMARIGNGNNISEGSNTNTELPSAIYGDNAVASLDRNVGLDIHRQYLQQALPILSKNCASCHSGPGKGGVSLFNGQGQFSPNVGMDEIWFAVKNNKMPKGASEHPELQLPVAHKEILKKLALHGG